ncbi:MAG TPA: HlyD family efflux transporter periplasmic adaptor subunit [Steroidobacteraceae bacterium]|nr:HlyD family efflux transporter periplasmic adaptor subunit [Steroidobacteraceae bacterium]
MSSMDFPVVLSWWRRRSCKIAGATVLGVGACALLVWRFDGTRHFRVAEDKLTIGRVTRGTFNDFIPLRARVVPRATIYLDAIEGGRVEEVMVEPGDMVEAGQPLVRLSNTELELVVLDREARLIESITQLQARQSLLEQDRLNNAKALARIDYDVVRIERALTRRKSLASESQEQRDNLQDELTYNRRLQPIQVESNDRQEALRVQQLPQIAAQLTKLLQDVEITRAKLASLLVRAPLAGRMTAIDLTVGENRNRGERLGELTPESGVKLVAAVDEFYLGRLRAGQTATVEIAGSDLPLAVERIYPQVKGGAFTVDLKFVTLPPLDLTPGQAVQGKFALGAATQATMLDVGPFLQATGGDWVFVLDKDGSSAARRRIQTGRRNIEQLEILAGLEPGERVIISDYNGYGSVDRIDIQ